MPAGSDQHCRLDRRRSRTCYRHPAGIRNASTTGFEPVNLLRRLRPVRRSTCTGTPRRSRTSVPASGTLEIHLSRLVHAIHHRKGALAHGNEAFDNWHVWQARQVIRSFRWSVEPSSRLILTPSFAPGFSPCWHGPDQPSARAVAGDQPGRFPLSHVRDQRVPAKRTAAQTTGAGPASARRHGWYRHSSVAAMLAHSKTQHRRATANLRWRAAIRPSHQCRCSDQARSPYATRICNAAAKANFNT